MVRALGTLCVTWLVLGITPVCAQDWLQYLEETTDRLVAPPDLGIADIDEKDFAWADVDQDGDVDLVVVRKQPWMSPGRRQNVLFMNEGIADGQLIDGVLVDRTAQFVSAANDGGQGFLDPTCDRDAQLIDVTGDGWLDIVTSTAFGAGLSKTLSHPRVYRNLGAPAGTWLGFIYEEFRTPLMPSPPNFCGIAFGDVTGNGALDVYFTEYETNLEDRLWINDGTGTFTDESVARMTYEMRENEFGVFAVNADINADGVNDIIKVRSNGAPYRVSISYNDPANPGFFDEFEVPLLGAPYYVDIGDLNNDGLLDIVAQDDGIDRYLLNQGNGADGLANFIDYFMPAASNGFSGKTLLEDLNNDGFLDVIQSDTTLNGFGCSRHLKFWRNLANPPVVTFAEETGGLPLSERTGTWDVAPIDLNGDGWLDLVIGRCSGISIWMAEPPASIEFTYPEGRPLTVSPGAPHALRVAVNPIGAATIPPGGVTLHTSLAGGPFNTASMTDLGGTEYSAPLPIGTCLERIDYFISVATVEGDTFLDPVGGQSLPFATVVADTESTLIDDPISLTNPGWSVVSAAGTIAGWEAAVPNGTFFNGDPAAPSDDAGPGGIAFVTGNGVSGGAAGAADLDGGPSELISPGIDLSSADGRVTFDYWLFSELGVLDTLELSFSNDDGNSWSLPVDLTDTEGEWVRTSVLVSDHVSPSALTRVRFSIADQPNDSITEAGVDNFRADRFGCGVSFLRGDCNTDGMFDVSDAVYPLEFLFGSVTSLSCEDACDATDDGMIDIADPIYALGALFSGGASPPAPFPGCGVDPTDTDALDCGGAAGCP